MSRFLVGAKNLTLYVSAVITRPTKEELLDLGNMIYRASANTDFNITYTTEHRGIEYDMYCDNRVKNIKILKQISLENAIHVDSRWEKENHYGRTI